VANAWNPVAAPANLEVSVLQFPLLLLLLVPAFLANMAPPLLRFWAGWNPPIDDRLLGAHKTLGGFIAGVATAVVAAGLQARWMPGSLALVDYGNWFPIGLALGLGAMSGDCVKSAIKRWRRKPPGSRWMPFDQLDFIIGALVFVAPVAAFQWPEVIGVLVFTFVADTAVNRSPSGSVSRMRRGERPMARLPDQTTIPRSGRIRLPEASRLPSFVRP
jgi:CDP-2,3-bis-(O-geranylgeranyl)-sn-glycerol synthase